MKITFPKRLNIAQVALLYIFSVLYMQIVELFLPFGITKIMFLFFSALLMLGCLEKKIGFSLVVLTVIIFGAVDFLGYLIFLPGIISYVYPPIVVAIFGSLIFSSENNNSMHFSWKLVDKLVLGYCLIHILLYSMRLAPCFQDAGTTMQFKGALPHSNMFGTVLLGLLTLLFWGNGILAWVNKGLIILLVLTTQSRTYIAACALVFGISFLALRGKQIRFYYKLLIATVLGILLLWIFSDFLVKFIPQLARFKQFAFSGNGRDVLRKAYHEASADTNIWGRLAGIPMTKRYLQYITVEFSHSFSENSYMGISLIFGLSGVLIFLYMLCRLVKRISCAPEAMVLCIWLFTFFFQDTLLSVQTGILFVFSTFIVCGKHRELLGKLPKEG